MKRLLLGIVPLLAAAGIVAAALVYSGGSSKAATTPYGDELAVVGRVPVTQAQVSDLLGELRRNYASQKKPFPPAGTSAYRGLRDQALTYLVQVAELDQKARELGVAVTGKQVDSYLEQVKQQSFGGDEKQYRAQLAAQGLTVAEFRDQARLQLLQQGLYAKITASVKVPDSEVKSFYDSHRSQYAQPDSRTVRHILVKTKPLADKIYRQLQSGGDFGALAKKYSIDPGSKSSGGKLTVSRGQTVAPFDKVAFSLPTGGLSKPVKSQFGWHVIQALTAVKKGGTTPLSQVSAQIRQQLQQSKSSSAAQKWVTQMQKQFCGGKIAYAKGYAPQKDPCTAAAAGGTTTTGG